MKKIVTIILVFNSLIAQANEQGEKDPIFIEQLKNANQGIVISQKNIGAYYYFGYAGVKQDYKKSFQWFEKAAKEDNQQSQEMLAYMYSVGQYVEKNENLALFWHNKSLEVEKRNHKYFNNCQKYRTEIQCSAQLERLSSWDKQVIEFNKNLQKAKGGNIKSQYNVSRHYLYGEGTNINNGEAISWIMKSANKQNTLAAYNLAVLFYLTKGVGPDFLEFMEIAEKKDEDAKLIMKLIRLDERNYHLENYAPITEMIRPFMSLKY